MHKAIYLLFSVMLTTACTTSENIISEQQRINQDLIDSIVSGTLFDQELDNHASYKIRNDGMVVIKFDDTVSQTIYTDIVHTLRTNKHITMLRAEQSGVEVCALE